MTRRAIMPLVVSRNFCRSLAPDKNQVHEERLPCRVEFSCVDVDAKLVQPASEEVLLQMIEICSKLRDMLTKARSRTHRQYLHKLLRAEDNSCKIVMISRYSQLIGGYQI